MQDIKAAIAVDKITLQELKDHGCEQLIANREKQNMIRQVETPDDTYIIMYWDWENPDDERDQWIKMLTYLEHRRHARIEITEDGDIFTDIETEDEFGCDEVFNEILGWKAEICLWQNTDDIII